MRKPEEYYSIIKVVTKAVTKNIILKPQKNKPKGNYKTVVLQKNQVMYILIINYVYTR